MTAWQFMDHNPGTTLLLAVLAAYVAVWPFRLVNRWIRHRNIAARGWPPPHLDADGDVHRESKDASGEDSA